MNASISMLVCKDFDDLEFVGRYECKIEIMLMIIILIS